MKGGDYQCHLLQVQSSRCQVNKFGGAITRQYLRRIQAEALLIVAHHTLTVHAGIAFNLVEKVVPDSFDLCRNTQRTKVNTKIDNLAAGNPQPFQFPFRVTAVDVFNIGHLRVSIPPGYHLWSFDHETWPSFATLSVCLRRHLWSLGCAVIC